MVELSSHWNKHAVYDVAKDVWKNCINFWFPWDGVYHRPNCFYFDSVEENCFYHESKFLGVNFPADGPVMKKMTINWEPCCEKIIPVPRQGILKGDVAMYLLLKDGGRYRCQFNTVYKYVILFLDKQFWILFLRVTIIWKHFYWIHDHNFEIENG